MRQLIFLIHILIGTNAFSQHINQTVDSLANEVNVTSGKFRKALSLEKALIQIVIEDLDFYQFKAQLNVSTFNPRMLLTIEAHDFRVAILKGKEPNRINSENDSNPYKVYFLANSHFFFGEKDKALRLFKKIIPQFLTLQDTFYAASTYNNIGTLHYINNNLDSGLTNFLLAKEYTYWFNEMLEANILAISNALGDKGLSQSQINTIHSNSPNSTNGVYYNNAYYFFDQYYPDRRDSLVEVISNIFTKLSDVPDELYRVFIREGLLCDSMAFELLNMPSHVYFDNAIDALLKSNIIKTEAFTYEVLDSLKRKSGEEKNIYKLAIFNELDSARQFDFIELNKIVSSQETDSDFSELKALITSYKSDLENSKAKTKNILIISILIILVIILLVTTFYFRQKVHVSRTLNEALKKNQELELAQIEIEREMNETRSRIISISLESLEKLEALKKLIQDLDNSELNKDLLKDFNIIRTHQDGITRFKINRFCEDLHSEKFFPLENILSSKELQVLKLMVLGFRSKEIATLIDVSHQYVNNQRHKIRSLLQDSGYDFEVLTKELRLSLYFQ
ncbi:MAG: hypothetical protein DA445_07570 [Bacteroidetes bacterium]|nr:MAG: hypothetical protein DA445_07570 [Bacteroidota bacterium]